MFLYPEDVDSRVNWPHGTAQRLAKRHKLPHILLPDGSIRFDWDEVADTIIRVPAEGAPASSTRGANL